MKINEKEVLVVIFGGATKGGSGWGITGSGKIIKIPDNNPLNEIAVLAEVVATTRNSKIKSQLENIISATLAEIK